MNHKAFAEWAEDRRTFPYVDSVGKITVGIGRNLDANGLSEDEIDVLYHNDHAEALRGARTFDWFERLDEVRQMVVTDMIFNMGLKRFSGFKRTIKALSESNYQEAAKEMVDSAWFRQVRRRAVPLVNAMSSGELEFDQTQ